MPIDRPVREARLNESPQPDPMLREGRPSPLKIVSLVILGVLVVTAVFYGLTRQPQQTVDVAPPPVTPAPASGTSPNPGTPAEPKNAPQTTTGQAPAAPLRPQPPADQPAPAQR